MFFCSLHFFDFRWSNHQVKFDLRHRDTTPRHTNRSTKMNPLRGHFLLLLALLLATATFSVHSAPCDDATVNTIAGTGTEGFLDGPALSAELGLLDDVKLANDGSAIFLHPGVLRKLSPNGTAVTTIAGGPTLGYVDGIGAAAQFGGDGLETIAIDCNFVYVGDYTNNRIRKVSMDSGVVTTYVGSDTHTNVDGPFATATLRSPRGLAIDSAAKVMYVAVDQHVVRRIDMTTEYITTIAGTLGVSGYEDGVGTASKLYLPWTLSIDRNGDLIVAELGNFRVRKVTPGTNTVTTVAGNGVPLSVDNVDPLQAGFAKPLHSTADGVNNLFVMDFYGFRIRRIDAVTGAVTTVAGSSPRGFANGIGCAAKFDFPTGLAMRNDGTLIVADYQNFRLRSITGVAVPLASAPPPQCTVTPPPPPLATCTGDCLHFRCPMIAASAPGGIHLRVEGSTIGTVWGSGPYTSDSSVPALAVHAGLLMVGETKLLHVSCVGELTHFVASTAHAVTSLDWETAWSGVTLTIASLPPPAETCFHWWCARRCVTAGQEFEIVVKGQVSVLERQVWGDVFYSDDSDVRVAAVHAGILVDGEEGTLVVSCHGYQASFASTTRNGVTSEAWGEYPQSWSLRRKA
jgi:hypothetical protein